MKSYNAFVLVPLLLSLNIAFAGTARTKKGTAPDRSPASSSSNSGSNYDSQNQQMISTLDGPCGPNGIAVGNSCSPKSIYCNSISCKTGGCAGCEGYSGDNTASTPPAGEVDDLAIRKMPKDEFMKFCSDNAPAGTDCNEEYNERHREMIAGDKVADNGSAADCAAKGGTMSAEVGCVGADGKKIDDSKSKEDAASAKSAMCEAAHTETAESCDSESKSWMSSMNEVVSTLGPAMNQINPSTCGGVAAAQSGAAGALATFQLMCNSAMKKCTESCTGSTIPTDVSNLADCKKIGVKAGDANKSAAAAMMTLKGSVTQCQNAFGDMDQQATAYCASNPASCAFKPMINAQSTNPMGDQAGATPPPGFALDGVGGKTGNGAAGLNMGLLGDDADTGIGTINPSKPGEDPGGNKGGGHVGASGGGQGGDASGGRGGGGKKEGFLSNILSGFFGSGGGGSGSGGGFFSKLFGGNKNDAYASNNPNVVKKGPDLRQFLPGGLHDPNRNRGIAGQFIGKDGMAGPHSDIWKNINNRYQFKRASLVP